MAVLDCEDGITKNNKDSKLFFIKGEATKEPEETADNYSKDESIINNTQLSLIYESKDTKAKGYAIYIFCVLQTTIIIAMVIKR